MTRDLDEDRTGLGRADDSASRGDKEARAGLSRSVADNSSRSTGLFALPVFGPATNGTKQQLVFPSHAPTSAETVQTNHIMTLKRFRQRSIATDSDYAS